MGVFATEFWRRGLRPVKGSRIVLPFPVARGRALVFPARMPDSHRLPFAIVFGPRVVRYRLNTHLPSPHHFSRGRRRAVVGSTGAPRLVVLSAWAAIGVGIRFAADDGFSSE